MKEYEILDRDNWDHFVLKTTKFLDNCLIDELPFPEMNITVKKFRKNKTKQQHKFYWACINELRKGFREIGYEFNQEQIHEFIKSEYGYCDNILLPNNKSLTITKSIADKSEDVNIKIMKELIDFMIRWAAQELNWIIKEPN